jgi:hypothetical protein
MIFSRKNAGKWVASNGNKVVASSAKLPSLMKKVEARKDKSVLRFDLVPKQQSFVGSCGISLR